MKRNDKAKWRRGANIEELVEVSRIDERLDVIRAESEELTSRRYGITNRACVRARYQDSLKAKR